MTNLSFMTKVTITQAHLYSAHHWEMSHNPLQGVLNLEVFTIMSQTSYSLST